MANKPVTLREVAEATGFAINTVSRALKNQPVISQATRTLIQQKAREMGYVPNRAATALRSGRSRTIACIVGYLINPFFGMIYEYISHAAEALNYNVMLFSNNDQAESETRAIRSAVAYGVDGIVMVPCQRSDNTIRLLRESNLPFVMLSREFRDEPTDCVLCNEEEAGCLATRHLMENGHRKLIYVCDEGRVYSINRRRQGFLRAVREAGLPEENIRIIPRMKEDPREDAALQADMIVRLHTEEQYTGIAAFCDMQARHLIAALGRRGLHIPMDMGCIGFDNLDNITPSPVPLCSVGSDYRALCEQAVALLQRRIQGDDAPPQRVELPVSVICRGSCEAPHCE